jgi:phosphopentomutase
VSERGDGSPDERRAIVIVIDACGVGALPDAAAYGDEGTNTLLHVAVAVGGLELPTLTALGLGNIAMGNIATGRLATSLPGVPAVEDPAIHGRLYPLGPGKDSTTGHWELMGVVLERPLPVYPEGFPLEVIERLVAAMGHPVICNRPYNGIAVVEDFGAEHLRTGALILYTSQDSVLQLAAHAERVPAAELYRACAAARASMTGEHAVGRVIARPFAGERGAFRRTEGRRDFALRPPGRSYLEELQDAGVAVHGVGKISDLFAGMGVSESHPGSTNERALERTGALLEELEGGLVFVNLIDTDQVHGHREDVQGFHHALREIDAKIGDWLPRLRDGDLLIVTADHGVDPAHPGTDHTREYAPLLAVSGEMVRRRREAGRRADSGTNGGRERPSAQAGPPPGARHDGPLADVGATVLRWLTDRDAEELPGESFIS